MGTVHPIKKDHQEAFSGQASTPKEITGKTDISLFAFNMVHAIPGRLRFVFPHLKNRKEMISHVTGYLFAVPGIDHVHANHFCASITVLYDHRLTEKESLVEHLERMKAEDLISPDAMVMPENRQRRTIEGAPKNRPAKSSALWTIGGTFFVALSFLGIIIPGLPTPPFVILAAYCYLRGSKRHYRWLMNHPVFSKLVEETDSGPRISRKAKKMTVYLLWFSICLSCIFFIHSMLGRMMLFMMGMGVSYYMLRK